MDENRFRRFQAVMKVVTAVGAVIVFFVGLHRFHAEQAQLIQTQINADMLARQREFRRELWLRQFDVLSSIAETASRIAATVYDSDTTAFEAAVHEYERLYWGNITFVDDSDLVRAMDALRHEIRYFRQGLEPVDGLSGGDKIKQRAHGVAIACRRAIRDSGSEFIQSSEKSR